MTDEEINRAIAEACGWRVEQEEDGEWCLFNPDGIQISSDWDPCTTLGSFSYLFPKYTEDLNAMHKAERTLFSHNMERYGNKLAIVVGNEKLGDYSQFYALHAPARQRAEAFLKTIGKWTTSPKSPPLPPPLQETSKTPRSDCP